MGTRVFSPGFRFSAIDFCVLLFGFVTAGDLAAVMFWPGIAIAFVIGNFFLFGNVVRMAPPHELAWATTFVALSSSTSVIGLPSWAVTLAVSFAATVILVALEMRKPSYHGVFWRQINPNLPQWWAANAHG